jgi:SAM-dependent methyltransferase
MPPDPLADIVSAQYRKWVYPDPIADLPAWLVSNWQWFDPSHAHRLFWPDRDYRPDMDILVSGCGTSQAAVFAYTNPGATVVGIDISEPSLNHHQHLKEKYGLKNLELHLLPVEDVDSLGRNFDLVISTGVLHHLADPGRGMRALAGCLRPDGVAAIMLYARYGRIGVEILQSVFRDLGLRQDEISLAVVQEAIASMPPDHPVRSYLAIAPDLSSDAGLVDTFLHGRDRSYTVDDCLGLITSAGLVFQDWFLKSPYFPPVPPEGRLYTTIAALPEDRQWSVMERINTRNACHFFLACHPARPQRTYRIDFALPEILEAVPAFRYNCGLDGNTVFRPGWRMDLDPAQAALLQHVDGHRTIREIVTMAEKRLPSSLRSPADAEHLGRTLFRLLWQRDFLVMGLQGGAQSRLS